MATDRVSRSEATCDPDCGRSSAAWIVRPGGWVCGLDSLLFWLEGAGRRRFGPADRSLAWPCGRKVGAGSAHQSDDPLVVEEPCVVIRQRGGYRRHSCSSSCSSPLALRVASDIAVGDIFHSYDLFDRTARIEVAILMVGRLSEVQSGVAAALFDRIRAASDYLISYSYGPGNSLSSTSASYRTAARTSR